MYRRWIAFTLVFTGCSLAVLGFTKAPRGASSEASATTAPAGEWQIVPSPNTTEQQLLSVQCLTSSDCWSVGYYLNFNGVPQTLVEHWNGSAWAVVSSPNTSADEDNLLRDVYCTSTSDCWAAGYHTTYQVVSGSQRAFQHVLVEHWDGAAWSVVGVPEPDGSSTSRFFGVTCVSATNCWAVGQYVTGASQTLIEHWDGAQWSIVTSANANDYRDRLLRVTCASANDCTAIGDYTDTSTGVISTLIEHWDGNSWTVVASLNPSNRQNNLESVACTSANDCWAVGYAYIYDADVDETFAQTLIEHWNGAAWSVFSSPNTGPTDDNFLYDVRCTSASNCWAIGYAYGETPEHELFLRWNGTAWSAATAPAHPNQAEYPFGLACTGTSDCWIVGENSPDRTLTEHWNGSAWSIVASPSIAGGGKDQLNDVTCVTRTNCWAVGTNTSPGRFVTYLQHWDGTAWTDASTFPQLFGDRKLNGITCLSASNCWAVGSFIDGWDDEALLVHYDGTSWTDMQPFEGTAGVLNDVACVASNNCWAVGGYVILHWNGSLWSTNDQNSFDLSGIACNSSSDCWAVGGSTIAHWNGSEWLQASSPDITGATLNDVACTSATNCWAVGYIDIGGNNPTLIEHWDGTTWSAVTSPSVDGINVLSAVTCPSASQCWAVGSAANGSTTTTLIEYWDGDAWSIVSSPNNPDVPTNVLAGLACSSPSMCFAVGSSFGTRGGIETLIEQFTTPCDSNPPVVSVPQNITVNVRKKKGRGRQGAIVRFSVSATDPEDGPVTASAKPPSGSFFPFGTRTVTVTATDHCGNTATKTFTVTVKKK